MKNSFPPSPLPLTDPAPGRVAPPTEVRDPGWDRRPARGEADPRADPPDRIPFHRDAADRWLR